MQLWYAVPAALSRRGPMSALGGNRASPPETSAWNPRLLRRAGCRGWHRRRPTVVGTVVAMVRIVRSPVGPRRSDRLASSLTSERERSRKRSARTERRAARLSAPDGLTGRAQPSNRRRQLPQIEPPQLAQRPLVPLPDPSNGPSTTRRRVSITMYSITWCHCTRAELAELHRPLRRARRRASEAPAPSSPRQSARRPAFAVDDEPVLVGFSQNSSPPPSTRRLPPRPPLTTGNRSRP
jgi:hypothetical protein